MKKLTAGIFTVLIGLCAANSADAAVASKDYVDVKTGANADAITALTTTVGENATAAANATAAVAKDLADYKTEQDTRDDGQDTNISNLTKLVGTLPEGTTAKDVVDYVNVKTSGIATDAALSDLQETVSTNTDAIATINGDANTAGSFAKAIADAVSPVSANVAENATAIADLEGLVGTASVDSQIDTKIDALNLATTYAPIATTYTKEEVDGKISNDGVADAAAQKVTAPSIEYAQAMIDASQADLEDDVEDLQGKVGETAVSAQITAAVEELANGAVAANTGEINTLKGTVNDTTNGVLANAEKAAANAAAIVTANGKIAALETTVNDTEKGVLANAQKAADNAAAIEAHSTAIEAHTTAISDINNSDVMKSGITAAKVGVVDGINAGGITDAGKYVLTATVGTDGAVSDYKWEIIERSTSTGDEA